VSIDFVGKRCQDARREPGIQGDSITRPGPFATFAQIPRIASAWSCGIRVNLPIPEQCRPAACEEEQAGSEGEIVGREIVSAVPRKAPADFQNTRGKLEIDPVEQQTVPVDMQAVSVDMQAAPVVFQILKVGFQIVPVEVQIIPVTVQIIPVTVQLQ
jgi:hypothetical protein